MRTIDKTIEWYKKNKWKLIGSWAFRKVYDIKDKFLRGDYVIKYAKNLGGVGHNINEYEISHAHHLNTCHDWYIKMYPKIIDITNDGIWMIVERAEVCTDLPKKMYKWFEWDIKEANFWYIDWSLVKLDFGMLPASVLNHYNNTKLKTYKKQ